MLLATALVVLFLTGASAQRCRWNNCGPPPAPTQAPTTTPPPPALGSTQSMWGQCGGRNWEYATACPTDAYCYNDGDNEWYSQCLPIEDQRPEEDPNVETHIVTTIFDVPGPTPTVVTTYITVYLPAPEPTSPPPPVTVTAVPDTPIQWRGRRWDG